MVLCRVRRLAACLPDDESLHRAANMRSDCLDEAPFMVPLMSLLLSGQFPVLSVTECLTSARFGIGSNDRCAFFPDLVPAATFGVRKRVRPSKSRL